LPGIVEDERAGVGTELRRKITLLARLGGMCTGVYENHRSDKCGSDELFFGFPHDLPVVARGLLHFHDVVGLPCLVEESLRRGIEPQAREEVFAGNGLDPVELGICRCGRAEEEVAGPMPMKLECISLVCRMVKVFLPFTAAQSPPGSMIVTPTAAETARNSRRVMVSRELQGKDSASANAVAFFVSVVFIDCALLD
jgi:hypothetical protein